MIKIIAGSILNFAGLSLIFFRRPLLANLVGKTKIKLGLFFGVDRIHTVLNTMLIFGIILIVIGDFLIFLWFKNRPLPE